MSRRGARPPPRLPARLASGAAAPSLQPPAHPRATQREWGRQLHNSVPYHPIRVDPYPVHAHASAVPQRALRGRRCSITCAKHVTRRSDKQRSAPPPSPSLALTCTAPEWCTVPSYRRPQLYATAPTPLREGTTCCTEQKLGWMGPTTLRF